MLLCSLGQPGIILGFSLIDAERRSLFFCFALSSSVERAAESAVCGVQQMLTADTAVLVETGDSWFNGQKMKLPEGCL